MWWVVTGPVVPQSTAVKVSSTFCFHTTTSSLSDDLGRFWNIEEVFSQPQRSEEEQACEGHYVKTHRRNLDGRYVLRLPFIRPPDLGDSKKIAQARFLQSEQRLLNEPAAKKAYSAFIGEMISLGHMERVHDAPDDQVYFMPQQAVANQDGSGKIKVVSNASQATSNGRSLNDFLHTGPKLQAVAYGRLPSRRSSAIFDGC